MSDRLLFHESEDDLVRRWPHLQRPGRGAHNQEVFCTLEEQLQFARIPRAELQRQRRAQELLQLLARDLGRMVSQALKSSGGKRCG